MGGARRKNGIQIQEKKEYGMQAEMVGEEGKGRRAGC